MAKRTYVVRDGGLVEVTDLKKQPNLLTIDKEEMIRRDSCYVLDDLRQDYQRTSDEAEAAHNKGLHEKAMRDRQKRYSPRRGRG